MHAVEGYIDGSTIVTDENLSFYEGRDVVITVLDSIRKSKIETKPSDVLRRSVAERIAGLWQNHNDNSSVDKVVRDMRKGHSFDY